MLSQLGPPRETLALRVLRRLARLLQAVLLALLDPRVPGQEASLLEERAVVHVDQLERPRDPQPQGARLAGDAAARYACDDVEAVLRAEGHERLVDELLVNLVREIAIEGAAVDLPLPRARHDADPRDRFLAAASTRGVAGEDRLARRLAGHRIGRALCGVFSGISCGGLGVFHASVLDGGLHASGLGHASLPRTLLPELSSSAAPGLAAPG